MNYTPSIYPVGSKEPASSEMFKSLRGLIFGSRAMQFDAFLPRVPTSAELMALSEKLKKPDIQHVIFDVDGTLLPPYAPFSRTVLAKLRGYQEQGKSVTVYSDSGDIDRYRVLKSYGVHVAATCVSKPSVRGFDILCNKQKIDPAHTAMVGNFPVTDMPLVEEGQAPYFPFNILVESIPPRREFIDAWGKYIRARVFHTMNVMTAGIVKYRNPKLERKIPQIHI